MALGLMSGHMRTQHGRVAGERRSWASSSLGEELWTYQMAFPTVGGPRSFPVEGCTVQAATRTAMQVNVLHWHVRDTVVILEEGNFPHPRCPRYNMLVPWRDLNGRQLSTAQCTRGAEQKRRRIVEEEMQEISERVFHAYVSPLYNVMAFNYLGRVMTAGDDDLPSVAGNLQKARTSWG